MEADTKYYLPDIRSDGSKRYFEIAAQNGDTFKQYFMKEGFAGSGNHVILT